MFYCHAAWIEEAREKGMKIYFIPPKSLTLLLMGSLRGLVPGLFQMREDVLQIDSLHLLINMCACFIYLPPFFQTTFKEI